MQLSLFRKNKDEAMTKEKRKCDRHLAVVFLPWQSNGEKVGENAGRQPDAIRFDVIG